MASDDSTSWTLIRGAADGDDRARAEFARLYRPAVEAYLTARWRTARHVVEIEDAVQDVFVECFRDGGALGRADSDRPGGFRAFLYGVVRNVARRAEQRDRRNREVPAEGAGEDVEDRATRASVAFDREWARSLMRQAGELQERRAREIGGDAVRRVELLRLRVGEGLPVRDVARLWDEDPVKVHREYARARREFRAALRDVVATHHPGAAGEVDAECERLLDLLG